MSNPQVGSGEFAVVPTFKGFRTAVNKETDAAAKSSGEGFKRAFSNTGTESGKKVGQGFKQAFGAESSGFASKAVRELESSVAKAASALSAARLKEQDAAGKVRVAERQLAEAREKYADDSSQVIRAEEKLATANRQLEGAQDSTKGSTKRLQDAQQDLARQADRTADQLGKAGRSGAGKFASGFSEIFKGSFAGGFLGNIASNLVSNIGAAIGQGLRAGIEFGIGTIDIASSLNESVNAVNVAYGSAAGQVLALGENSAKGFALSARNLNSFAVQFSGFANTIRADNPAGFIQELIGRGTDFASVFNLEVADALQLFQSGLAGETEPLRRFGIDLSAAAVESFAYANGLAASGEELTEAQKQQARYGLLLEQTAKVQGDFANTSGELANQNRINSATWEDLQAKIGTGFLPIATTLAGVLADKVFPAIDAMVTEQGPALSALFAEAAPAFEKFAAEILPKLPPMFEAIGKSLPGMIEGLTQFTNWLVELVTTFRLVSPETEAFFATMGEEIAENEQRWGEFQARVTEIWEAVVGAFGHGADMIGGFFGAIGQWLGNAAGQVGSFFGSVGGAIGRGISDFGRFAGEVGANIGRALSFIGELPGRALAALGDVGNTLFRSGQKLIGGFIDGIKGMIGSVGDAVGGVVEWARGFFPSSPAKRGPLSGAGWAKLRESGSALMEQWQAGMQDGRPVVPVAFSAALGTAPGVTAARVGRGASDAQVQFVYNGDFYSYNPDDVARQSQQKLGRLLDAAPLMA